jgi:hypothetical protein
MCPQCCCHGGSLAQQQTAIAAANASINADLILIAYGVEGSVAL